jgi:hypothetical protein
VIEKQKTKTTKFVRPICSRRNEKHRIAVCAIESEILGMNDDDDEPWSNSLVMKVIRSTVLSSAATAVARRQ